MKKVLFATTALVMTAGVAAAEVAVTGEGRVGLRYESDTGYVNDRNEDGINDADSSWNVVNRIRVRFTMTGESQSGISFGAKLRSDQHANAGDNNSATAGEVWVSGAYGKLTVGDIDSAMGRAVGDLPEVGLTGLDFWNEFAYMGSEEVNGPVMVDGDEVAGPGADAGMLYEYSIGNANLYASWVDGYYGNRHRARHPDLVGRCWLRLGQLHLRSGLRKSRLHHQPVHHERRRLHVGGWPAGLRLGLGNLGSVGWHFDQRHHLQSRLSEDLG